MAEGAGDPDGRSPVQVWVQLQISVPVPGFRQRKLARQGQQCHGAMALIDRTPTHKPQPPGECRDDRDTDRAANPVIWDRSPGRSLALRGYRPRMMTDPHPTDSARSTDAGASTVLSGDTPCSETTTRAGTEDSATRVERTAHALHSMRPLIVGGDLEVRRLGFGTGQLTGTGYWGPRGHATDAIAVLRRAVELGATLVDTADNYGPWLAEELVAEALHPYAADVVVATKGGVVRTGPNAWHIEGSPQRLREMCEASLRRLRVETIDLYQLHRFDPDVPPADQLGALAELRQEGKIRHIGLNTVGGEEMEAALEITDIASVQNRYNLLDRADERLLALCEERGIAFLPWFPLGYGSLTNDPECARIARSHDATPGQVALAWLLQHSPVLCPAPGTGSLAHLEENLAAATIRLTADEVARLDALSELDAPPE